MVNAQSSIIKYVNLSAMMNRARNPSGRTIVLRPSSTHVPFALFLLIIFTSDAARADAPVPFPDSLGTSHPSVHESQLLYYNATPPEEWPEAGSKRAGSGNVALTHEVHGWHPWWMGTAYTAYDWSLISTVAFFSLELNGTGGIVEDHGWPWTALVAEAHAGGARVIVTATLFSAADLTTLLSSAGNRVTAIANLVSAVQAGGADGVNVDFEGVPSAQKQSLVLFLSELRSALDAAIPNAYVSIATPAVDWANAFDYDELALHADHLVIMGYDYHWSGSASTGPVSPLQEWGPYNLAWTVNDYMTWGALPGQLILGLPWYGWEWAAETGDPGAATTSTATARTYTNAMLEVEAHGLLRNGADEIPWYAHQDPGWKQGWFDDSLSLSMKYDHIINEGLAGTGIWALGYDGGRPELWDAIEAKFGAVSTSIATSLPGPGTLRLSIAPNPFNPVTWLTLKLAEPGNVRVVAHDLRGREVDRIFSGTLGEGDHRIPWKPPLPSGVYWIRATHPGGVASVRADIVR